ncbi:MAG: EAL domain-containing protein [Spirochaetales bacterium]|nr:EAL domain-containing protein [Spirochaetales bacterium]
MPLKNEPVENDTNPEHLVFPTYEQKIEEIKKALLDNTKLAVIFVDLTPLKFIESKYGKQIFENMLDSIKNEIVLMKEESFLNDEDIVTTNYISSEYFYIFLVNATREIQVDIQQYEDIANQCHIKINNNLFTLISPLLKEELKVNVGFAVTFYNPSIKEERLLHELLEDAHQMANYQESMQKMTYKEKVFNLIVNKRIKTYYQPIVDLRSLKILGYQASSRGPEKTEFENSYLLFHVAKEIGLLYELDWLCKINIFLDARNLKTGLKLFVNILSTSVYDTDIRIKYLEDILDDTSINPKDVIFEISEKNIILDLDFFNKIRKKYRKIRFAVIIDDTWISSHLAAIKSLDISYIKLNINLIRDINKHFVNKQLVKNIKNMAEEMGAQIIAEGIQSKKELGTLLDLGIQFGQGYLFARPGLPFPEVNLTEMFVQDEALKKKLLSSIFLKRGMDYYNKGDFDKSILEFSKVIEVDRQNRDALYHRALAYFEDGSFIAAGQDLVNLIKAEPKFMPAYFSLGQTYEKQGNTRDAVSAYQRYMTFAKEGRDAHFFLVKQRLSELKK